MAKTEGGSEMIHRTHTRTVTSQPRTGLCDCGRVATRKFAGWECDECLRKRMGQWQQERIDSARRRMRERKGVEV